MYLMPPRYIEYLSMCAKNMKKQKQKQKNLYLKYFEKYLTQTIFAINK